MLTAIANHVRKRLGLVTQSELQAACDLTRTTYENKNHWKDADALSGRAAYTHSERKIARERSRMERASNSWYSGMIRTARAHIVGTGPRLQVLTPDPVRNDRIEKAWKKHALEINLTDTLGTAIESDWTDGEWFAMRAENKNRFPISTDVRAYEADQVSQPYFHQLDRMIEDGKKVDELGNAVAYWIYDNHPGDFNLGYASPLSGSWYPAADVIHLYRTDRPGQLRGFPRCAPAIDWLAHMRRFSKATLSVAERATAWGVFVKTSGSTVVPKTMPDFASVEWERNALNFMPDGWEPMAFDSKHPGQSNAEYQRTELTYFCRCANMPYSLASGTSRDSNFSSAKMDIKNLWEPEVKSEQDRLNRLVMTRLFRWFLEDIAISTDILDGVGLLGDIEYKFYWPPVPHADETDVATAAQLRMSTGQSSPAGEAAIRGDDYEQQCITAASNYGVPVDEYKRAIFAKHFAIGGVPGGAADPAATSNTAAEIATPGAFAGTRRRDFTNNQKATAEVLQSMIDGASEVVAKASLIRLGWSESQAQSLIEDARDGAIDSKAIDPSQTIQEVAV